MLRSAAKGFFDVTVITDASDYAKIQEEIETSEIPNWKRVRC